MIGAVQGSYTSHLASYSNLNLGAKVLPVNPQTSNAMQTSPAPDLLATQSAKPVQYSNTITTQQTSGSHSASSIRSSDSQEVAERNYSQSDQAVQQQVQAVINQLKARDAEVRAHEMAHLSTAGGYARGGMSFTYQMGPDGKQYAIGGEVGIDTTPVSGD
ncbi:MAG: putative metalloprotease CJM1_0395 family protein, partial [Thiomicrorhabdus sp.]|nr:putative metalloprotease CJM1_0395 family protein [Thiomicrorhabdus sp.]